MTLTKRAIASAAEYYYSCPEKIEALEPQLKKLYWAQRSWHSGIKMTWVAGILSDGLGKLTYPDGTIFNYAMPIRTDR